MGSIRSPNTSDGHMSSTHAGSTQMRPSWEGFVSDTKDALILFEAVAQGKIPRVSRRPHDRERNNLIKSGSIFIYDENASGIKRWTDGVNWSPSRILGNFLIYRELEKPFPPGEKKRATKKLKRPSSSDEHGDSPIEPRTPTSGTLQGSSFSEKDLDRSLVGSLQDSYTFKEGGLIKKTMSVNLDGAHYHLVSYYNPEDVKLQTLQRPIDQDLRYIQVRPDLIHRQNFRAPVENFDLSPLPPSRHMPNTDYMSQSQSSFMPPSNYMAQSQQSLAQTGSYGMQPMQHQQPHYQGYADSSNPRAMPMATQPQQAQQAHSGYYTTMPPPDMVQYAQHYPSHSTYDRQYQEQQQQHHHQQQQQHQQQQHHHHHHQQQHGYKMDYKPYTQQWPGSSG